ncbi:MAG TPA: cation diffusion facilitator family transporter [Hyphomicrobium sp.]|nr:cation diffusion facilitator family transporter [Hyphomicrobium sp.]
MTHDHHVHDHHDHDHHDHGAGGHAHAPKDFGLAFAIGTTLNITIVVLEGIFGVLSNSMALLADAGHNLSDVFGLLLAWGASTLVKKKPTARFTYGMGASSILAALGNSILLLVATGAIAWEAIGRLWEPEPVSGITVMVVAGIGILANGFTAWLFTSGRNDDINVRAAFLHMAGDAAISLGVVIAGGITLLTGWLMVDPIVSLIIAALIVWSTWSLLKDSMVMAMQAVPPGMNTDDVRQSLEDLPGVSHLHDLHIWAMSTTKTALTCHLVMPAGHPGDRFLSEASHMLASRFKIDHATFQIEVSEDSECNLESDDVI